ncbi:hypothetical protein BH18CHL1_BH18CHL1_01600 [soil metagenome]
MSGFSSTPHERIVRPPLLTAGSPRSVAWRRSVERVRAGLHTVPGAVAATLMVGGSLVLMGWTLIELQSYWFRLVRLPEA